MHYTQGTDYVDIGGGVREFVDQSLPGTPGTVDPAESSNAVQYEIINCILHAGLTVATTAANDRTAGWLQLRDAIFGSAAINTNALTDLAVTTAKLDNGAVTNTKIGAGAVTTTKVSSLALSVLDIGTANMTGGTNNFILSQALLTYTDTATGSSLSLTSGTGTTNAILFQNSATARISRLNLNGWSTLEPAGASYQLDSVLNGQGLTFTGGPGGASMAAARTDGWSGTSMTWTVDAGTARLFYSGTNVTLTGLPWGSSIYNVRMEYIDSTSRRQSCPVQCAFINNGGNTEIDFSVAVGGSDPSTGSAHILWVTYNSATVD